jgi:formyltetrahydrofolate deformylase
MQRHLLLGGCPNRTGPVHLITGALYQQGRNIQHPFVPAFIGANPNKQVYERGVKIIGATAHFVTDDLDEGPIIAQDIIPVDHTHSARAMARAGRDVEKIVLARALGLAFDDRVVVMGNKAIIFD